MKALAPIALALLLAACAKEPAPTSEPTETATKTEAQAAYEAVNARMHAGMASVDADADVAFMQGMLAHHRGAVEMSEVALKYGKDEKVRDLASRIIKAQAAEIAEMEEWLKARGTAAPASAPAHAPAGDDHAHH